MLGNATASCGMMVRLAQLQDAGVYRDDWLTRSPESQHRNMSDDQRPDG